MFSLLVFVMCFCHFYYLLNIVIFKYFCNLFDLSFTCNNFSMSNFTYFNCWSGNISNFHLSLTSGFSSNIYIFSFIVLIKMIFNSFS